MDSSEDLKALGSDAQYFDEVHRSEPNSAVLEKFRSPSQESESKAELHLKISTSEFTCLCPKTGQPDWATIRVWYTPDSWCLESKSFKLYLMGYRNFGIFHEAVVDRIANDLVDLLDPIRLTVKGEFAARGGISFQPIATYAREEEVRSD